MFFLAFATQYFSDINSDFWFKESKQATTRGFPTTGIISKILHFGSFSHACTTPSCCACWFHWAGNRQIARLIGLKARGFTAAFR
jgi:hypothetical protein